MDTGDCIVINHVPLTAACTVRTRLVIALNVKNTNMGYIAKMHAKNRVFSAYVTLSQVFAPKDARTISLDVNVIGNATTIAFHLRIHQNVLLTMEYANTAAKLDILVFTVTSHMVRRSV